MSTRLYISLAAAAVVGLGLALSCTQDDGERCQIHSDCASNICCKTNPAAGNTDDGVCTATQAACDELRGGSPDADADAEAETEAEAEAEAQAEAEAEAGDDVGPDTAADVETDTVEDTATDTVADTEPDVATDTAADTEPDASPDADA